MHICMRIHMVLQDTAITVTTTVQVKCAIGIKSGHLSMSPDDRRNRRDGSEVNDMCACFAISNTDADEDICYASFTKYSDSPLEVFPSTYAEFCEEVRESTHCPTHLFF